MKSSQTFCVMGSCIPDVTYHNHKFVKSDPGTYIE